ncbi:MAG: hypothetical protein HFG52_16055 [Lachnospiraceae bacterium]|nr:hypothetical protein [Lachnospiraceae bacterium]
MLKKKNYKKGIIICFVIVLFISLPIIYYNIKNEPVKSLLLGVISSIIASLIFHLFSEIVFDSRHKEIEELQSITRTLTEMQTKGILSIRGRNEFDKEFWISLLRETNDRLVLSGRTLNRWIEGSIKAAFEENLKRILQSGGEVTLIIYKELPGEEEQKEKDALRKFLEDKIFSICIQKSMKSGNCSKKKNIKLNIYEIDILPYLYNSNENSIIVAPYFKYVDNSNNIMFNLKRDCKYGSEYVRDFEKIIAAGQKNTWLTEYLKKLNENNKKKLLQSKSIPKREHGGERK